MESDSDTNLIGFLENCNEAFSRLLCIKSGRNQGRSFVLNKAISCSLDRIKNVSDLPYEVIIIMTS